MPTPAPVFPGPRTTPARAGLRWQDWGLAALAHVCVLAALGALVLHAPTARRLAAVVPVTLHWQQTPPAPVAAPAQAPAPRAAAAAPAHAAERAASPRPAPAPTPTRAAAPVPRPARATPQPQPRQRTEAAKQPVQRQSQRAESLPADTDRPERANARNEPPSPADTSRSSARTDASAEAGSGAATGTGTGSSQRTAAGGSGSGSGTGAGRGSGSGGEANWRGLLASTMAQHKRYPRAARRMSVEGTVTLHASFDAEGHVLDAAVRQSSGSGELDEAALALLRQAADIVARRMGPGKAATLTIPVHYQLNNSEEG